MEYTYVQLPVDLETGKKVLFVTAFKDLGRTSWAGFERSVDQYVEWFSLLAALPIRLICFCEPDIAAILGERCGFYNTYPYEEHDTFLRFLDKEREIMESKSFKALVGHRTDPETNKPGYNSVNHNKTWFLKRAKSMFSTAAYTHYAWIDFGAIREPKKLEQFDFSGLGSKIVYGVPNPLVLSELPTPIEACRNVSNQTLYGSEFYCPAELVDWYYQVYYDKVMWYYANTLVDDDQEIVKQLIKDHPASFELIPTGKWFELLSHFKTPLTIDVVIPTCLKDLDTLQQAIRAVRTHVSPVRNVYIVCSKDFKDRITDGLFVDEESFPFKIHDVAEAIFGSRDYRGTHGRAEGWWFQQLLKLYASQVIPGISSNLLILDSETIFYNRYMPIQEGVVSYAVSNEVNPDFRRHMNLLLNTIVPYKPRVSGVCHQMLFQTHVLQNLFDRVERAHGIPLWKVMLEISKRNHRLYYSEYDMYFNFMMTYHKRSVRLSREVRWDIVGEVPKTSEYTYLTAHAHIRGESVPANTYVVPVEDL